MPEEKVGYMTHREANPVRDQRRKRSGVRANEVRSGKRGDSRVEILRRGRPLHDGRALTVTTKSTVEASKRKAGTSRNTA